MKIYKYTGFGYWLESAFITIQKDLPSAIEAIKYFLSSNGLVDEELTIEELEIEEGLIIYKNNGDY